MSFQHLQPSLTKTQARKNAVVIAIQYLVALYNIHMHAYSIATSTYVIQFVHIQQICKYIMYRIYMGR